MNFRKGKKNSKKKYLTVRCKNVSCLYYMYVLYTAFLFSSQWFVIVLNISCVCYSGII